MLYTIRKPAEVNDDWSYQQALCLGDEELHWDGGEPEDNYFRRDWGWVPGLLNKERSRWIQLQKEIGDYLTMQYNADGIDDDIVHEMRYILKQFDPEKE